MKISDLLVKFYFKNKKTAFFPKEKRRDGLRRDTTLLRSASRKEPHEVQPHSCNITVATGKTYKPQGPSIRSSREEFTERG